GRACAHVINILDPEAIVLGGGLSNVPRWYERVPRLWSRWVFADRVDTILLRNPPRGPPRAGAGSVRCRDRGSATRWRRSRGTPAPSPEPRGPCDGSAPPRTRRGSRW